MCSHTASGALVFRSGCCPPLPTTILSESLIILIIMLTIISRCPLIYDVASLWRRHCQGSITKHYIYECRIESTVVGYGCRSAPYTTASGHTADTCSVWGVGRCVRCTNIVLQHNRVQTAYFIDLQQRHTTLIECQHNSLGFSCFFFCRFLSPSLSLSLSSHLFNSCYCYFLLHSLAVVGWMLPFRRLRWGVGAALFLLEMTANNTTLIRSSKSAKGKYATIQSWHG